jgi:hypothetical protein
MQTTMKSEKFRKGLCDSLQEQIDILQVWGDPVQKLRVWMRENVEVLTGNAEAYDALDRVQYRLEVQGEIMRMIDAGELDAKLKPIVGNSDDHNEEEADVPD